MTIPDDEWRGYLNFQELALVDMGIVYYISQYKDTKNINIFENSFSVLLNRELVTDMCNILNMEMRDFSRFARATSEKISALLTESTNHTL